MRGATAQSDVFTFVEKVRLVEEVWGIQIYCVHENETVRMNLFGHLSESCSLGLLCFLVWPPVGGQYGLRSNVNT